MKKLLQLALLFAISCPAFAATWYVRPDGGTRYSTNITTGQCNGQADAPYPGTGTNQPCAFSDYRMLFQDGSYNASLTFPSWGWVISGGDTVIVRGSITGGVSYRVGWPTGADCFNVAHTECWGVVGNASYSPPPVPSGTSLQPTRILGENYASCSAQSARTQLHGGYGLGSILNLQDSSYVEVQCFDLTDFAACGRRAGDTGSLDCHNGAGGFYQDYTDRGIDLTTNSTHITLNNIRAHGLSGAGVNGAPGDGFVATNLDIIGNAFAGWDGDNHTGTTGTGSFLVQRYEISWNGCVEEYPIVDPVPIIACRDQSTGGYGDGFGTTTTTSLGGGWQIHFDDGIVSYNTQDGLDMLHVCCSGSSITITRTLSYGNEGAMFKVGGAATTLINNIVSGNCDALDPSSPPIPGRPVPTQDSLGSICRQAGVAVYMEVTPSYTAIVQDNTVYTGQSAAFEVEYANNTPVSNTYLKYNNNVFIGAFNSGSGENPSPLFGTPYDDGILTRSGSSFSNNAYLNWRPNWPCPGTGETNAICGNPGLADQTYHVIGYSNAALASNSSAVKGAGVTISGITTDYNGTTRANPPTIGACETTATCPGASTPVAFPPVFTPNGGTFASSTTLNIDAPNLGGIECWNTTGAPATNGASGCANGTKYTGPLTVSSSATYYAVAGGSGFIDSSVSVSNPFVIGSTAATPTFSPVAGTYTSTQSVTISSTTSGATLCYTTDGSTPTANGAGTCTHGTTYSTAVSVSASLTLKAVASKSGLSDSAAGSAAYVINIPVVPSGSVTGSGTITGTVTIQ